MMSNYGPNDDDEGNRREPRDTSEPPESPVIDVQGQSATFGDDNPFTEEEMFKRQVQEKFNSIWLKTFK